MTLDMIYLETDSYLCVSEVILHTIVSLGTVGEENNSIKCWSLALKHLKKSRFLSFIIDADVERVAGLSNTFQP